MTLRRSRRFAAAFFALAAVVALGACSSDKQAQPTKTVTNGEITIDAFDIHFDVGDIKTEAGPLKITLVNRGAVEHTFRIEDKDFELKVASNGDTDSGTVILEPGTYEYDCTIPGHASQGMKGEIQVS
jgi:plastocyanin